MVFIRSVQVHDPEQTQQHQLVEKEVGYHCVAPFHGGETGALYLFCRLLNYPHDRGTYMDPPALSRRLQVKKTRFGTDAAIYPASW